MNKEKTIERSFAFRQRLAKAIWIRIPILAVVFVIVGLLRAGFLIFTGPAAMTLASVLYSTPWFVLSLGGVALLLWRLKVKENPFLSSTEKKTREPGSRRKWILWSLGVRTPTADSEYGERLARYRRWSSIPVAVMSIAVFFLILVKIGFAIVAIQGTLATFNEATVVAQYFSGMSEGAIIMDFMTRLANSVMRATPLPFQLVLLVLWLFAFVIDFIVAATLAEGKRIWWKRHWGGIITAIVTIP